MTNNTMHKLLTLTAHLPFHNEDVKRLRIAVTEEELREIRDHCMTYQNFFAARVRDVPLIVEDKSAHEETSIARINDVPLIVEESPMLPDLYIEQEPDPLSPFGRHTIRRTLK